MLKINDKKLLIILGIFLALEILSFTGYLFPSINQITLIILTLATLILTAYRLEYGLLIILGELFIGSMGHLFYGDLGGRQLTVRTVLWAAVMLIFAVKFLWQLAKQKKQAPYYQCLKNFSERKTFGILFIFIIIGLINGLSRGHSITTIFSDFNAWLYFLLLLPLIITYGSSTDAPIARLKKTFFAGALWLSLKTLFLLFVFTHNLDIAPDIYSWLRKSLVGEMTPTLSGWPRVFIQGQIFPTIGLFLLFWINQATFRIKEIFQRKNIFIILSAALFSTSILISFSRSFWVGAMAAIGFSLLLVWRYVSFKKTLSAIIWLATVGTLSFLIIYLVVAWPYWHVSTNNFSENLMARISDNQGAAVASRWSLLPVLGAEIKKEPFLGQGFGATVTYFSRDPRILQNNPSGEYTTSAFEWGYLDIWLKLGILGLIAYLFLIFRLIKGGLQTGLKTNNFLFFGLSAGILFLAVTNIFTPYLNHPLGIGFLLVSSCLIWPNRVY
jgi:hypothetical protein